MAKRSFADIEKIWSNVEGIKKLSDRAVGFGPFGVGLDGLLTWIPVVGTVYSVGAGGWLLLQALRAKASPGTILRMVGYLGIDSATTVVGEAVPFAPDVVDFFFPGHLLAAKALQKDIETTHWVEASEADARTSGDHDRHLAAMRADPKKRRIVYLHD
ncbi:DUF4112 domain-containing protein [Brevundimonas sp.]|jgi:hypothetical protein|uniref:DUF4112 domain-containing protein n=1 Tax=Brevundimonas sp. TaxID=1871086 RepID=UPI00391CB80E|nr:DUF4112 domain-containing protein [Brevundimonas sp.]MCA3717285.1 DUF4112 domain-containing protein [Brevundimonas sp.]